MTHHRGSLSEALDGLNGKSAWGLTRTHGSMFFLEVGNLTLRPGEKRQHGEWHFLFELCHWRFEDENTVVVGSDDPPQRIDEQFRTLQLQTFDHVEILQPSNDLRIVFSSGVCMRTFTTCSLADDEATQWHLFDPCDNVWTANLTGQVFAHDANE